MDLLQNLVDVRGVRLDTSLSAGRAALLGALAGFLGGSLGHCKSLSVERE